VENVSQKGMCGLGWVSREDVSEEKTPYILVGCGFHKLRLTF
jgi:hypothetical protein